MKVSDVLEMATFDKTITKKGLPQYENENFLMWGAEELKGWAAPDNQKRIRFAVMDIPLFYERQKAGDPTPADSATVGTVQIFVDKESGEITGLIDIEIDQRYRNSGRGSQLIQDIKDTTKKGFDVYSILNRARKFWEKAGIRYEPDDKYHGRINK